MERRRVAEVCVEEDGRYGSGYLITDRLVLTARHVAEPVGAICQVSLLPPAVRGGAATAGSPRAACTVWVSSSHDVALVALDRPAEGYPRHPVRFGFVDPNGLADECCRIGFPDAQRREGGNADRVVKADLSWVSRDGRFNVDIANTAPDREKGWKGLSGMALFAKDGLLAVIEAVPPNFAGGVLTAIGVASFCDDSGFLDCLRRHDANGDIPDRDDGGQPVGFRDAIVGNLFFIDRIPQVSRIIDAVNDRSAPRGRPLLYLIPGEPDDVHQLVVPRLAAEEEMRRFLGRDTDAIDTIIEIPWPQSTVIDAPRAFRTELWPSLTNALCCQEAADVASVRRALDRPDAPRAFWTQINVGRSGPGHGELFRLWLDLWNDLGSLPGQNTVLLLVCLVMGDETPKPKSNPLLGFLKGPSPIVPDVRLLEVLEDAVTSRLLSCVEPLSPIERDHVRGWLDRIRLRCRQVRREQLDFLRMRIERRMPAAVSMRAFRDCVTDVLESPL